ncbi:MAG: YhdP family phospholipid transporter, partial [Methylomonas sp.]
MVIRHVSRATRHLLFWTLISAALAMSAVRIFLAEVADYKVELEQKIRETTHIPIRIGKIGTNMRGFSPGIVLQDIAVDSAEAHAKPAIQLQEIRIGIDLLQLLWTRDVLSASWVALVGAKLDVIRNPDGSIAVKGLHSSDEQPLWLLQGRKYEILQSEVSWQDLKNNGKRVHFHNLDLLLKNHYFGQSHEIHLLTTLPKEYGDTLRISAEIKGNIFEPNDLEGRLYVDAVNLQGPALLNGEQLPLGLTLTSGSGDVRLWSEWRHSSPKRIAGYIQAQQIRIGNPQGKTLQLDTLAGNVSWLEQDGTWRLGAYDVDIFADCQNARTGGEDKTTQSSAVGCEASQTVAASRQRWPNGEFYLQRDNQGNWSGLIRQMHLQALAHIAPLLVPADNPYGNWPKLNPTGILRDFSFYLQNDWQHYALQGNFNQLGNAAIDNLPRLLGLTGRISGSDSGGRIELASENSLFDAPDLFRNTLAIKRLAGSIDWRQENDSWVLSSQGLTMDSPDFETESDFVLTLPKAEAAAKLDLSTRFGNFGDISRVPDYLPAKVMGADAVDWLDDAFIAGRIDQGELVIRGRLDQFPFTNGEGRFEALFGVENGELQFNEDWPHLRDLNADVQFLGADLRVAIGGGRSENVDIQQAVVTISNLADSDHVAV